MIANLEPKEAAPDARFTRNGIARGFRQTIPLALGTIAFGAAFGILARNSGLGDGSTVLMSLIVYSGTAQIVGIELWSAGASNGAIWGATALVSVRYVLLGFTMRDWFHGLPRTIVYLTLFLTGDQSWALTHAEMTGGTGNGSRDTGFFLGSNVALAAGWIIGTALGAFAGAHIPDPSAWGLEFAATAAFIAILAGTYRGRGDIVPWLVAATSCRGSSRRVSPWRPSGSCRGSGSCSPGRYRGARWARCGVRDVMEREFLITMLGMAIILYMMRIGGYVLISRMPSSPWLDAWLEQIPGATLVALVIPMVAREGLAGLVAGAIVWIVAIRTENLVLAMVVGVAIVALLG